MKPIIKSQLVELVSNGIAGGGNLTTKLQFLDQPYLRNKKIHGIEIFTITDVPLSPSGNATATAAQVNNAFLTLYCSVPDQPQNVGEWLQGIPLPIMHRVQNSATDAFVRQSFDMSGQVVYWEKCYFSFSSSLGNVSDVSFLINVYFKG